MAPKTAKIWNEDLVMALRAREEMARQQGKQRQYLWRDGAQVIEGVRNDIYVFKTGRVVGLPTPQLKKTVDDLCRKIIAGDEPVLPDGCAPSSADEQRHFTGGNALENHPYLKRIKIRGGSFAVLMAFYVCGGQRQNMTKDQIIRAAQPYCDEAMEGNYHAGRPIGAWKGHETLVKHGFLHVQKAGVAYNERAGGLRALGKNTYSLTLEGELFTEALLQRHPEILGQLTSTVSTTAVNSRYDFDFGASHITGTGVASPSRPLSTNEQADRRRLMDWVSTATAGSMIVLDVGKDRRKHLHRLCDDWNHSPALRSKGLALDHRSDGASRERAITVSMVRAGAVLASKKPPPPSVVPYNSYTSKALIPETPEAINLADSPYHLVTGSPLRNEPSVFTGSGRPLDVESPSKRFRTTAPDSVRAACENAALLRRALFESTKDREKAARQPHLEPEITTCFSAKASYSDIVDVDSPPPATAVGPASRSKNTRTDMIDLFHDQPLTGKKGAPAQIVNSDSKPPAKPKRKLDFKSSNEILDLLQSDNEDDEDELLSGGPTFQRKPDAVASFFAGNTDVIKIPQGASLSIVVDSRERNRNCTPRYLRTQLVSLLSTEPVKSAWPVSVPPPEVSEMQLTYGDFNFLLHQPGSAQKTLPVVVERKRIGDLVQRSAARDHWGQLQRIRDRCSALGVLLLEGDFRTAPAFVAFCAPEEWRKSDHIIDDEHSLLRFLGRAILSSDKIRFVQTKDEHESLRAVAALGLVSIVALSNEAEKSEKSSNPYQLTGRDGGGSQILADRLQAGGIPWQIAKAISQELGSIRQIEALYSEVDDCACRDQLLAPLIEDACLQVQSESTAHAWSRAIHSSYYTTCSDPNEVRLHFQEVESFVSNKADLLAQLHRGEEPDEAINASFDANDSLYAAERCRSVQIHLPEHLCSVFDNSDEPGEPAFYRAQVISKKNLVVMQTADENFESDPLLIFLIEGTELAKKIRTFMQQSSDCYSASRSLAADLDQQLCRRPPSMSSSYFSRRVLLIRGLRPALEQLARQEGYRPATRFVVDLVLAHLMITHGIVVLQAVRKGDAAARTAAPGTMTDQTKILRALALACFHFQLLTKKRETN
ncbi:hypothetical protein ACA910_005655 [Epithemia clementina (nom. ined.)]